MKVENINGFALRKGKIEWWFKLTWGEHGGMWAVPFGEEYKPGGIFTNRQGNRTLIELENYDIKLYFNEKELNYE